MYTKLDVIHSIRNSLYFNSDNLSDEVCFYLCANKELLNILVDTENQLVFGKRGTGKTTLLLLLKNNLEKRCRKW